MPCIHYKHMLSCVHMQVATNEVYATLKGIIEGSENTCSCDPSLLLQGLV